MTKLRITLEVDTGEMFDMLSRMQGDADALGGRLVGILMTGEVTPIEAVGLDIYGVVISSVEKLS